MPREKIEAVPGSAVAGGQKRKLFVKTLVLLLVTGLVGTSVYYFKQYKKIKDNPDAVAQEEVKVVTDALSKIMELPEGEEPTIATVSDKDKLKEQDFFKKSENGDKILVYASAKKAILFRPTVNKVIEVAPLILNEGAQTSAQNNNTEAESNPNAMAEADNDVVMEKLNVAIQNGTKTAGLAGDLEKKLSSVSGISVVGKGNAKKDDYAKTLVIDLSKKNSELVEQIAQAVGGEISTLPGEETKPDGADVLIIAGK